jgi:macrolide transport system ATP-binding/permease protein
MLQDVRYALRLLGRNRGFALTAIGSIALGIASCTAIVSLVYTLLLRPLPVPRAQDIVSIYGASKSKGGFGPISVPDYMDLAARDDVFEGVGGYIRLPAFMDAGVESERVVTEVVTGNYHALFHLRPAAGRLMTPADDQFGAPLVAVLSHRFWRQRFDANPSVVGVQVRINGQSVEIVGVAPASFTGVLLDWYGTPDLWMPLAQLSAISPSFKRLGAYDKRSIPILQLVARMRSGLRVEQVNAALHAHAERLSREYPSSKADATFVALPSAQARFWPGRRGAAIDLAAVLLASVVLLLLIAVLNVANLLVARLHTRAREISVRLAIGAARVRVVRQLLVEGLVLSGMATAASIPLSIALTSLLAQQRLPFFVSGRGLDLSPDWRVFAVIVGLCLACGLLLGVMPAWRAWHADVRSGLTNVPAHTPTRSMLGRWDLRYTLAALQIAVCLMSTVGAALLAKSLIGLMRRDLGFQTERVTLLGLETYLRGYTGEQNARLYRDLVARVRRLPGVESVAFASNVIPTRFKLTKHVLAPGALDPTLRGGLSADLNTVTPDYFETVRLPLVAGRAFREADSAARGLAVAIVDERAARRVWGSPAQAIGQRIRIEKEAADREIVGVARNAMYRDEDSALPYIFLPVDDSWTGSITLHVRGPRDVDWLVEQVRRELRGLDRSLAFSDIVTLDDFVRSRLAAPSLAAQLAVAASAAGFVLAMIGLYAVLVYLVSQRRTELAIRMAIGATPREIMRFVAGFGVKVALSGTALGMFGSFLTMRLLTTHLSGVDVHDPLVYVGVSAVVLVVALAACLLPARRAARLEPWVILRR